ncbi:MAG: hypothetical protein Q8M94_10270, partial [Ignavibacteria bacterium]|nr:hypothetical protein [Ignavibacteria bacterium]
MINRLLKRTLLLIGFLTFFAIGAKSQSLQEMTCSISDATYNKVAYTLQYGYADDTYYAYTMPFTFKFDNVNQTTVYFCSNGYIIFTPFYNYSYYSGQYITDVYASVQAIRYDLIIQNGPWGLSVQGAAPNRVLVFQWENVDFYYSNGANMNFQIKLYETSNKIEICYGSMSPGSFGFSAGYYAPRTGFTASATSYINIEPASPFVAHFSSKNPGPNNTNSYT